MVILNVHMDFCFGEDERNERLDVPDGEGAVALPGNANPNTIIDSQSLERLQRVEKLYNLTQYNPDYDDMSHIDYFFHEAFHMLKQSIPQTDEECYFNITAGRCFPVCKCSFQLELGDYTLSRACRYSTTIDEHSIHDCLANYNEKEAWAIVAAEKVVDMVKVSVEHIKAMIPSTDKGCYYDFRINKCVPIYSSSSSGGGYDDSSYIGSGGSDSEYRCSFQWKLGDFTPHRACRIVDDDDDYDDGDDDGSGSGGSGFGGSSSSGGDSSSHDNIETQQQQEPPVVEASVDDEIIPDTTTTTTTTTDTTTTDTSTNTQKEEVEIEVSNNGDNGDNGDVQ